MAFFKNLFRSVPEESKNESDLENEDLTKAQRIQCAELQKEGEMNNWGKLITFYDYNDYTEMRNFGMFAVYEKCLIFHDEHSGKLMIPRNSFISNEFGTNVCKIEICTKDQHENEWIIINLFTDTSAYKSDQEFNFTSSNIYIKKSYIVKYEQLDIKINKLLYWYYSIKAKNPHNLADYNDFCLKINSYENKGYESDKLSYRFN